MPTPTSAFGTTFTWDGDVIGALTAINGIDVKVNKIDTTTHQSANAYTEFIPGLLTSGDVSLEGLFDYTDVGQVAMVSDMNARSLKTGIITFPVATGSTWTFSGYIVALKIGDAKTDGTVPFSATVSPTGKPVFAIAIAAGMSALTFNNSAVIEPTFAIGVFDYVATVLTAIATIILTPTSAAGTIVITANGTSQTVLTGQPSSAIALGAAGSITVITITISEANKAPKTYVVRVVRGV